MGFTDTTGQGQARGQAATRHPVPCPRPPPHPCQLGVPRLTADCWEKGSGEQCSWWQRWLAPSPDHASPQLHPSEGGRTVTVPTDTSLPQGMGARWDEAPLGQQCPWRGRAGDVAPRGRGPGRREPSRGHGSTSAAPAGPRSHVPAAAGRGKGPSPAPAVPGEVSQPGVQAEHTQHTFLAGGIPARQRDPPFTESGDFSQGGPALALLELAAAMASPPAGSRERRHLSTAPTAPREPKHSPMLLRVPGTAGTRGKGWATPGKHRLPLLINQPCTTGNAVSLGEEPLHGTATSQAGQCHLQTPPLGT